MATSRYVCEKCQAVHEFDTRRKKIFCPYCGEGIGWNYLFGPTVVGKILYNDRSYDSTDRLEIPEGVTRIEWKSGGAFCGWDINEIVFPSSLESIPSNCFKGCRSLKKVMIPGNIKEINFGAFDSCHDLEEIIFSEGVEKIGAYAFDNCEKLRFASFPATLKSIDDCAFGNAPFQMVVLPNSIESVGENAFSFSQTNFSVCKGSYSEKYLQEHGIKYSTRNVNTGFALSTEVNNKTLYYLRQKGKMVKIPSGVEEIADYAFADCKEIEEVSFSNSVKEVGAFAFNGCSGIRKISFNDTLIKIGSNAFNGVGLHLIDLPASIKEIASDAFDRGCVVSVAGEMPFYGVALASIDKKRQELEGKEAAIAKLQDRAVMLETDLDSYINAMPPEFVDISQYKDQIDSIENTRAKHARIAAEKQSALTTKCKQIEADIEDLSAQHKRLFFLAVSKKKELDVSIQSKQNDLKLLQDKQKQLSEESASADKPLMDELASIKSKVKELESAQKRWEAKREALINAIAKAREGYQTELADLADMKAEIKITESALEKKHASWMAARDKVLLLESKRNLECEKATLLWNMQIPECDKITPYSFKPRKSVVEEVLLNEAYLAAIEDWNHENEVVVHNQFVERHTEKIKRVKEINISLKLPEDDGVSQFVTRDMPQLKSNYLFERFEKLNAYFAQKDFWKHFKRSTKDCVSKKKPKLCEKFFVESEYLCLSNGSVHLLLFPYCMVKYEAKKPLILLTYDKARFAVKCEEITETTDVIPPYGELLREQHMYLNADGSVSKRYKNNPIVKTIRFTTVTISEANMHFTCPFKALETALKFETAFNDYKNIFSGGEYSDIYKMILASADLGTIEDAIRNHDEAKKKLIAEEKERARAQHLSALAVAKEERKKLENARLAAQAAAEEKRRSLIQRQKELNEERKLQAEEKKKIYSLFEDAPADNTPEQETRMDVSAAPVEVISKPLISNNVFKVQVKQISQVLPEDVLCYFTTKDGTVISNRKKLANGRVGTETTIGFVLVSGIDFTQISSCLMRIESQSAILGEIDFKVSISFYSDF